VGPQTILQSERWIDLFAVSAKTTILLHPCHGLKKKFELPSIAGGGCWQEDGGAWLGGRKDHHLDEEVVTRTMRSNNSLQPIARAPPDNHVDHSALQRPH
jgi:hypothetical protein